MERYYWLAPQLFGAERNGRGTFYLSLICVGMNARGVAMLSGRNLRNADGARVGGGGFFWLTLCIDLSGFFL